MRRLDLGYLALGALLGVALAAACSANGSSKSQVGTGASSSGGNSGTGGADSGINVGGSGASGGSSVVFDAGKDVTDNPDAACTTVTQKASKPAVDVVWIVDNSCSMGDEIAKVNSGINTSFVPIISASTIDWRVLMISKRGTGSLSVCVDPPLAGASCADNPNKFFQFNCEVNSNNSLSLAGNSYASPNFNCAPGTQRWSQKLRFDATKVFVEVTDDEAMGPFPYWNASQFDDWALNKAQPPGVFGTSTARKYVFHGIIGMDPNDPTKVCNSYDPDAGTGNVAVAPGLEYQKLAKLTGGITRSICETDWSDIFNTIAKGIVNKLTCAYAVPTPPDGGTIDPDKVNVEYTPSGGQPQDVLQDTNKACDAGADGWQWDATKTKILLCGPTCDKVKADDNGEVNIVFGCKTKVVPPPQ